MKKLWQVIITLFIIAILLLITTCKEDIPKVTKLEIGTTSNVTETTATVAATFVDVSANVSSFGFCWATKSKPEVTDGITPGTGTAKKGGFSLSLIGLSPNTKYYVRAYAMEGDKEVYSSGEISFTTGAYQLPTLTTSAVTEVTHNTAVSGGEITDDGGQEVTARGVCWSTSENPTITDDKTSDGIGTATFTSLLTGLTAETTYYVRAYATNIAGIAYSQSCEEFTTSEEPYINISWPTSVAHWLGLDTANIEWESNISGAVKIELIKGTTILTEIVSSTLNDGFHQWNSVIDGQYDTDYRVRVTSMETVSCYAESPSFKISESNGSTSSLIGEAKTYKTIKIGYQWWMAENLREREYADGTNIIEVQPNTNWASLGSTDKAYCYYNNSYSNSQTYGNLYTWAAAMNGANSSDLNPSGVQGVCPDGWHLPSDAEWKEMEMYLGISELEVNDQGFRGTNEGSKLAGNVDLWEDGNLENDAGFGLSGFSALPGGKRQAYSGVFEDLGTQGYWWNSTLMGYDANNRSIHSAYTTVYRYWDGSRPHGYSVRCVRD
ncbi:MAG: fibrobacter succinogenes major paralogous domain-containing protein [Bacteroidota bacterium]